MASYLTGHGVTRAKDRGWDRLTNGDLLAEAERAGFDLLRQPTKTCGISRFDRPQNSFGEIVRDLQGSGVPDFITSALGERLHEKQRRSDGQFCSCFRSGLIRPWREVKANVITTTVAGSAVTSSAPVFIQRVGGGKISGLEFDVGNGYGTNQTYIAYITDDGSGVVSPTAGSIVGFSDLAGFSFLKAGACSSLADAQVNLSSGFACPNGANAIAIDNLREKDASSTIPEPGTGFLLVIGIASTLLYRLSLRAHENETIQRPEV